VSDTVRISVIVMLGAGGIFTGGIVWYAWERVWIWRRLALLEYAIDFRRSLRKADPAMPILLVVTASAATLFAWRTAGDARTLAAVGVALLATILVSSILVAEPINSASADAPKATFPRMPTVCADAGDAFTSSAPLSPSPPPRSSSSQ
jgi:hypothetical protein